MAHQPKQALFSVLGFVIWGDLGPTTLYRNKRGNIVFFKKTFPDKPASDRQQEQRDRMTAAAAEWAALTDEQRAEWEMATKRASLCMHGYDLWQHWKLTGNESAIRTIQRQTETTLLEP